MNTEEMWRDIKDYEDRYQVSDKGRVRSKGFYTRHGRYYPPKIKEMPISSNGYIRVTLWRDGIGKTYSLHRIIADAFIPNPDNKPCIDHINAIKTDNRIENLRWVSFKENTNNPLCLQRMSEQGKIAQNRPDTQIKKRLNAQNKAVFQFTINGEFVAGFRSIQYAEDCTGIPAGNIHRAANNNLRQIAGGYLWSFSKDEIPTYNPGTNAKTVLQFSLDGVLIAEYPSAKEAESKTGALRSVICLCCKGKVKTAGGFVWKYKEVEL